MSREPKKKKRRKDVRLIFLAVVIVCIVIGIKTAMLYKESRELSKKQEALASRMESEEQRKEDLEELEKYMKTKKYMEEVAKTKLGLVYPNEILIQPENK